MRKIWRLSIEEATPTVEAVLMAQGITDSASADARIVDLAKRAIAIYQRLGEPLGVVADISIGDFEYVFKGEGLNDEGAPLGSLYESSENLALFTVTIGERLCAEISGLVESREFPLGSMLDSTCSEGVEMAAQVLEETCRGYTYGQSGIDFPVGIMRFSPGYCGWHISAQKNLFGYLKPGDIGVKLNESCLMSPLKSISGVIVSGRKEIFQFDDTFDFCAECKDHSCRDRIRALMAADA